MDAAPAWPKDLIDALAADARVVGVADLTAVDCRTGDCSRTGAPTLLVVATWDGLEPLRAELPRLGAAALGAVPAAQMIDGNRWTGLAADARRAEVEVIRVGDLLPGASGEAAAVVHDPKGVVEQWIRWSRGRDREAERAKLLAALPDPRGRALIDIESTLRQYERLAIGAMALRRGGGTVPLRPRLAAMLRDRRADLDAADPLEAALAARIDAALRASPHAGAGYRIVPADDGPAAARERFLRVADGEGFLGDRVLFDAAARRLEELSRRAPEFDEGFVLPTFDAVEMRLRFGEGTGGCKVPLVPCVHVGVGVTPADHLEFWAGPAVRETQCDVAAVADRGERVVVPRTAGKDAFLAALHGEVDRAWDELPEFVRAARRAGRTPLGDADEALRPLHLPRSYREAAKTLLAGAPASAALSRMSLALALCRAGSDQEALTARKMGLAAGRVIALTPAAQDDAAVGDRACDA